jgi:hypothetical protein
MFFNFELLSTSKLNFEVEKCHISKKIIPKVRMASSRRILSNLERLKSIPSADDFVPPDDRLISDCPVECLRTKGVATCIMKIQKESCQKIIKHCIDVVKDKDYTTDADRLNKSKLRFDIELPPRGYCWKLLGRILNEWKKNPDSPWNIFKHDGIEPRLVEFSVLGSLPGSEAQSWHVDHFKGRGKLISFGIPLIDVQDVHGPLNCIPFGMSEDYKRKPFKVRSKQGHMFAWDGAMRHRGGHNKSTFARPVFMFSLCFSEKVPNGDDQSLHPEILQRGKR